MHGFIFIEFDKFVLEHVQYSEWQQALKMHEIDNSAFSPTELYPDKKMVEMLHIAAENSKKSPEQLLELFGAFLVPDLMKVYRAYIDPDWKSLDVLENAETTIHVAVRRSTAGAAPPILKVERSSPRDVVIEYVSSRNMPELGVGIIKGLGVFFNENLEVKLEKFPEEGRSVITIRLMQ
jgi:hypothetical protein